MTTTDSQPSRKYAPLLVGVGLVFLIAIFWFFLNREFWPRGEALHEALHSFAVGKDADQATVAQAIWANYLEARTNASWWSAIFFGFTFGAAGMSALAGLILKFESLVSNESQKKDIAAALSVLAAVLVTISSSGDFQRKWQANRVAAAELERAGYQMLEDNGANPRRHFADMGKILLDRHMSIVGTKSDQAALRSAIGPKPSASSP